MDNSRKRDDDWEREKKDPEIVEGNQTTTEPPNDMYIYLDMVQEQRLTLHGNRGDF